MARLVIPFRSTITSGNGSFLNTPVKRKTFLTLCFTNSITQQPLPVSPAISLIVLSEYWLNTVKMSATSVGLNHNVDDVDCVGAVHNLGYQVEHFFTAKS